MFQNQKMSRKALKVTRCMHLHFQYMTLVFYSTFATSRIWLFEGLCMYCEYPLYPDRLTYQLALSPSLDTNYDYDLH